LEHLNERHGPALAQRALHHLELRLRGVPTLSHLAPEIRALRLDLKAKHEAWLEAQDTRVVATSAVRYADDEQDRAVTRLSQGLLLVLDGDRGAARYRRVFPVPPSEVNIGVGTAAQQEAVAQILEAAKGEAGIEPLRLNLEAAFGALNAALADRVAAARAEASARMDVVLGHGGRRGRLPALWRALDLRRGRGAAGRELFYEPAAGAERSAGCGGG
jgi:hypothetical protein